MAWWQLELVTTAALAGLAVWLGPFLRRFGRPYAAEVFRMNPVTGKSYIVLMDVAYYLVFAAYILMTTRFEAEPDWDGITADQLQQVGYRVGGILLIVGVLHGANLLALPIVGRLLSLNRRLLLRLDAPDPERRPEQPDGLP